MTLAPGFRACLGLLGRFIKYVTVSKSSGHRKIHERPICLCLLRVHLVFGKIMQLLWQNLYAIGLIFFAVNEQIQKNNLIIWSHCEGRTTRECQQKDRGTERRECVRAVNYEQCDQIGQFIALRATFQILWQQIFCQNSPHLQAMFVKVSKSFICLAK